MSVLHWLEAGAVYIVIIGALLAGLAAAYGKELEARRKPDRHWWVRRLLIMPTLAIAATSATDTFGLSKGGAAFAAAMLSLGGYDAVCFLESRWRERFRKNSAPPAPACKDEESAT